MSGLGSPYSPGLSISAAARAGIVPADRPLSAVPVEAPVQWSGFLNGVPLVGTSAPMTAADTRRIEYTGRFRSHMFQLWDPDQKRAFDAVMQYVTCGAYVLRRRDDRYVAEQSHYTAWLEWVEICAVPGPPDYTAGPR